MIFFFLRGIDPAPSHMKLPPGSIAPENGWLEDEFPFGIPYFQGLC